jgi:hypothetical protein
MKKLFTAALLCACIASTASAQEFKFSGRLRERSEFDTKAFTIGQTSDAYHYLQTRFRADVTLNPNVLVRLELQDARQYGQKGTPQNTGAPALDLRQGFVEVKNLADGMLGFRLGRQELIYGSQRLIGISDWPNFGQTYDAGLLRATFGEVTADVFGAAIQRNANPTLGYNRDVFITGLWATWKPVDVKSALHGFIIFDNPKTAALRQNRYTTGINAMGSYDAFDYAVDGVYQFGDYITATSTRSIGASMICAKVGYTLKEVANLRIGAGVDMLSGNDFKDTTKYGTFNTLYGSAHGKYGHMDYFSNMPLHTAELGLQNMYLELSFKPGNNFTVYLEGHLFNTMSDPADFLPANTNPMPTKAIGKELDVWCAWKVADAVHMQGGVSVFDWDKDRFINKGRKTTNWAYLQTTVNF